jgi:hypothetical protein
MASPDSSPPSCRLGSCLRRNCSDGREPGEWYPVSIAELLKIVGLEVAPERSERWEPPLDWLLELPATLALLLIAIAMFCVKRLLDRAERDQKQKLLSGRQRDMITTIDQVLAGSRTATPPPNHDKPAEHQGTAITNL